MAHRRDAGRVERVVEPDTAALRQPARPSPPSRVTATAARWRAPITSRALRALPGQCQRKETRVTRRGLDGVAVAAGLGRGEFERSGALEGAAPHLHVLREAARDHRHRVEAQMAPDVRMVEAGRLKDAGVRRAPAARTTVRARTTSAAGAPHTDPDRLDTDRPSAFDQDAADRRVGQDPGTGGGASARWTRIPERFVPRGQPKPQLPQSPQASALRRVGAASQPSARAPRRRIASFGGMWVDSATPSSASMAATSLVPGGAGHPSRPWSASHSARTPRAPRCRSSS